MLRISLHTNCHTGLTADTVWANDKLDEACVRARTFLGGVVWAYSIVRDDTDYLYMETKAGRVWTDTVYTDKQG